MTQDRHSPTLTSPALVTGGTAGIGGAISQRLAGDGAAVAAGYWRHPERAAQFQAEMCPGPAPRSGNAAAAWPASRRVTSRSTNCAAPAAVTAGSPCAPAVARAFAAVFERA